MQFIKDEQKSGWLTKLGGNALRKTWKRRWFELRGSYLYYYRQQVCIEIQCYVYGIVHILHI